MYIVFDGPEKAGKTTLINETQSMLTRAGYEVKVRHWGKVSSDTEYARTLMNDLSEARHPSCIIIWDRSWASEEIYAGLLHRQRRARFLPGYCEWLYGRAVDLFGGMKFMLAPDIHKSISKRSDDDLPVNPYEENSAFINYSTSHGWYPLVNSFDEISLQAALKVIELHISRYEMWYEKNVKNVHIANMLNSMSAKNKLIFVDDPELQCESYLSAPFSHIDGWRFAKFLPKNWNAYKWSSVMALNNEDDSPMIAFGKSYQYLMSKQFNYSKIIDGGKMNKYFTSHGEAHIQGIIELLEQVK